MSKFYIKNHGVFYTTSSGVEKKVMDKLPDPWAIYHGEFENNLSGWSDQEVVDELVLLLSEEEQNEFKKVMACHYACDHLERFGAGEDEVKKLWDFCIAQNAPIERSEGSEVKKGGDWVGGDDSDSWLPESGFGRAKFRETFERLEWIEYRIKGKLISVLYYENLGRKRYVLFPESDVKIQFKTFLKIK